MSPGLMLLAAEMPDLRLHRLRHAADEHRQPDADGHRLAFGGEQAGGEIQRLVDDDVVGGAHEVGLHFLGHRDDAVAHDLGDDRIGLASCARALPVFAMRQRPPATAITRLPNASTSSASPGISTVVEAYSSISAGPSMRLPASKRGAPISRRRDEAAAEIDRPLAAECRRRRRLAGRARSCAAAACASVRSRSSAG